MGTRVCYLGFVCLCQDHPHAYGDKQLSLTLSVMLRGSSPRVWGQVRAINSPLDIERIIPTRMGTRLRDDAMQQLAEDHPHAYGDKTFYGFPHFLRGGSSPRVWGQGYMLLQVHDSIRIIPTRMGTSNTGYSFGKHLQDHPHAYGDKASTR